MILLAQPITVTVKNPGQKIRSVQGASDRVLEENQKSINKEDTKS